MHKISVGLLFFLLSRFCFSQQSDCNFRNDAFKGNEKLSYEIFYNWGVIWVGAGEANFTTELISQNKKTYFKFLGTGITYPKYDWFYKVSDKFETIADTGSLKPLRFLRDTKEGGTVNYSDNIFNFSKNKAYSFTKFKNKAIKADSVDLNACTFDVLSMIYYARNIDFDKYKPKTKIPISLFLDNTVYPLYIEYLGKEKIKTEFGEFNCIKFHPMLVEGTIFKPSDDMTVWVTDDKNKIPLYMESPIIVGTIKAKLKSYSGLRNPVTSKIK